MGKDLLTGDMCGKKVLITGASGGIGKSIVRLFIECGVDIGLHYNSNREQAEILLDEIKKHSLKGKLFCGDLTDGDFRDHLVESFVDVFGRIDILINNAGGVYDYGHFSDIDESSWDKTFALNAKAPFFLIRQAFDYMQKQNGGRIVNISTVSVKYGGSANNMHYVASKAALDCMTRGFARQGAKKNILVNSIHCGIIDNTMRHNIPEYSDQKFRQRVSLVPMGRPGCDQDIARMVLYLASPGGDFITGETFAVAGGD